MIFATYNPNWISLFCFLGLERNFRINTTIPIFHEVFYSFPYISHMVLQILATTVQVMNTYNRCSWIKPNKNLAALRACSSKVVLLSFLGSASPLLPAAIKWYKHVNPNDSLTCCCLPTLAFALFSLHHVLLHIFSNNKSHAVLRLQLGVDFWTSLNYQN